jgi:anti-sigma B factor antagonist
MHVVPSPPQSGGAHSFAIVRADESRASLSAAGELDLAAVEDLIALLAAHEGAGQVFIHLDLSAVTFMDCSCLGVLVAAHHRLRAAHGQLVLTRSSGPVIKLLSIIQLEDTLLASLDGGLPVPSLPLPRPAPETQLPTGGVAP